MTTRRLWLACTLAAIVITIGLRAAHATRRPDHVYGDGAIYARLAGQLLDDGYLGYSSNSLRSWRPPLYPTWIAGIYAVSGRRPYHAKIAECALSGLIALLIALLGRRLGMPWAGVLGGLFFALYGQGIRRDATLYSENSTALAVTVFVLLGLAPRALEAWPSFGRGLIAGLILHLQPALLVLPLALAAWTALSGRTRRHVTSALLLVSGVVVAVVPWTVRNYSLHGEFVLLTTNGGYNLLRGHNPHATGDMLPEIGIAYTQDVMRSAPEGSTEVQTDRWCRDHATSWMRDNPRTVVRLALLRLRNWWLPRSLMDHGSRWPVTYGVLFPFAVMGLIGIMRRRITWAPIWVSIIAAALPSFLVVYAGARYRTPVLPLIALLAGVGLLNILGFVRRRVARR